VGRIVLIWRLAVRDVRRHLAQALHLVVAIAAASATLTMALALNGVTSQPYAATRTATKGPDVIAYLTSPSQAKTLAGASGVTASSGPFPVVGATVRFGSRTASVFAEGRGTALAAVDQPDVTAGNWIRPDAIVLERTFAGALGVSPGDRVTLNGRSFAVAGTAVTAAQAPYPNLCYFTTNTCSQGVNLGSPVSVGVIWMTTPDATRLMPKASPLRTYALNLRLTSPDDAQTFVAQHTYFSPPGPGGVPNGVPGADPGSQHGPEQRPFNSMSTWQGIAQADALLVQDAQSVLEPGAILLAVLSVASVAVLVGRRLSDYARRVGLLKAVGGTPGIVAATFLVENLALALLGAVLGLVAGWLAAPLLASPGAALVGSAGSPALSVTGVAEVIGLAVVVSLAATLLPAVRAAHSSTIAALNDAARPPKRRGTLIKVSTRLPIPALFGLRLIARRPRRAFLSAANIAVTVTGLVVVLAFHADADGKFASASGMAAGGLSNPVINRDEQMLAVLTVMLVALSVLNAIFTTWATVLDARHPAAVMRALGARGRQVSSGLVTAQVLSALPGAVIGIPLGLGLYAAVVHGGSLPSPLWLVAALIGTLAAMAALTLVPAWIGGRQPATEALQAETA
jgi:putative ABC transport system permease protein